MSALTKEGLEFEPAITFQDVWVGFDEGQVLRGATCQGHEAARFDCQAADQPANHRTIRFADRRARPGDVANDYQADSAASRCIRSDGAAGHTSLAGWLCAGEFSFRS